MLEHLKYHCKHNEDKPNGSVAITVAAFDTESAAMEFVNNNPGYDVDEIWFMENQNGTWVPIKTVWTKEKKDCKNCGYRDTHCDTFKCNATGNCVDHEQWLPKPSDANLGKWKKTTIRHMTGEIDAYRCSLCGGTCQWKHKICPICKGEMSMDD